MAAAMIAVIVYPVFAPNHRHPTKTCTSRLRPLASAAFAYAEDHDDRLPNSSRWCDSVANYVRGGQAFQCPGSLSPYGFAMHDSLSSAHRAKLPEPEKRAFLFDSSAMVRNAHGDESLLPNPGRHRGRNYVAYADGHTRTLPSPRPTASGDSR